jgi:hypothetical protein
MSRDDDMEHRSQIHGLFRPYKDIAPSNKPEKPML